MAMENARNVMVLDAEQTICSVLEQIVDMIVEYVEEMVCAQSVADRDACNKYEQELKIKPISKLSNEAEILNIVTYERFNITSRGDRPTG